MKGPKLYDSTKTLVLYFLYSLYDLSNNLLDIIGTKVLKSFPPCYSQSPLLTDLPPQNKSGLKLV
jgi:hypothetical protein